MSPPSRPDYDGSYRKLFAERLMVLDLLRWYVPTSLTADLDLSQPLVPLNLQHILPNDWRMGEKRREGDVAFVVPNKEDAEAGQTFVMLEFQSSVHPRMDVRMGLYAELIWLQADRNDADKPEWAGSAWAPLDPVVPLVLYNGEHRWTRKATLRQRVRVGKRRTLRALQPDMDFHLIDIGAQQVPTPTRGPCDVLFALEQCDPRTDLRPLVQRLIHHTRTQRFASLREAFLDFMIDVLAGRGLSIDRQTIRDLKGLHTMLGQNIDKMRQEDRREGRQEGLIDILDTRLGLGLSEDERERALLYTAEHPLSAAEALTLTEAAARKRLDLVNGKAKNGHR